MAEIYADLLLCTDVNMLLHHPPPVEAWGLELEPGDGRPGGRPRRGGAAACGGPPRCGLSLSRVTASKRSPIFTINTFEDRLCTR
jgi:hypothetical protein